jgi:hypothetical protein
MLVVARRYDIRPERVGRVSPNWEQTVDKLLDNGEFVKKNPCYIDFFLFNKSQGLYANVPKFALGRLRWDNWLTEQGVVGGGLVDASDVLKAIHIHHPTATYANKLRQPRRLADEIAGNKKLWVPEHDLMCISDAQFKVKPCTTDAAEELETQRLSVCLEHAKKNESS